ncbi:hypothetical protein MWU65_07450 [Cellulophaga sp. F20128]|uniref:hypothetical protein n=1 Tax=Cellulophaga sp. F20128 TaxID=2926413 RepID=UPI001FF51DFC|nr:hypothetical protein [Cellulophaga sp. F20128]MCK0157011.1 hypothetical protein [Cellulophaga sp. F20128]
MKKFIGLILLMLLLVSSTIISTSKTKKASIEGTWELISFYKYDGKDITDTVPTIDGYRQIKMYNSGKVMWTRYVPNDSVEWFGYGTYKTTKNSLTENLEYMSASMRKAAKSLYIYNFELQLTKTNYSQITVDDEGNRIFSENYKRIN